MEHHLIRSVKDERDLIYQETYPSLRQSVDLRQWDTIIEDQEQLGSCVGQAITSAYELLVKELDPQYAINLSSLFVYYNSRLFEQAAEVDVGTSIRNGLKSLKLYGVCSDKLWPYDIKKFNVKPSDECYVDAKHRTISKYEALLNINSMLEVLNSNKPVVIAINVYDQFMTLNSTHYTVQLPNFYEFGVGHALTLVGYNLTKNQFIAKNSFGTNWGLTGYCLIPFEYIESELVEAWYFDILLKSNTLIEHRLN